MVSQAGAARIFAAEDSEGKQLGKLREKITSHDLMLSIAGEETVSGA